MHKAQVGGLLLDDPHNDEYKGIYESLTEVCPGRPSYWIHNGALRGDVGLF